MNDSINLMVSLSKELNQLIKDGLFFGIQDKVGGLIQFQMDEKKFDELFPGVPAKVWEYEPKFMRKEICIDNALFITLFVREVEDEK